MKCSTLTMVYTALGLTALLIAAGCENSDVDTGFISPAETDSSNNYSAPIATVIATDYSSGAVSLVATGTRAVTSNIQVVAPDTFCQYDNITGYMYLISRLGSDAVTVLDTANNYQPIGQYSVEAGTNAQGIAVVSTEKAFVPRLGSPELQIVHPTNGTELGRIDLSGYADADGIPDASQAVYKDGIVYVTLERIDPNWSPTEYSSVLLINSTTNAVIDEIRLTGKNPTGILRYNDVADAFILVETGVYGVLDGGIETMTADGTLSGLVITEETLGGDVVDAIITAPNVGFAVIAVPTDTGAVTQLVAFNPSTGIKLSTLIQSTGYDLSFLSLNGNGELWVADRNPSAPGIRIFDTATVLELTAIPVDVGLPPLMVCFNR